MNSIALKVLAASLLVISVVGGPNRMSTVITAPQEPQQIYRIQDRHHHAPIEKFSEGKTVDEDEFTSEYWHAEAKKVVEEQLKKTPNVKKAKNIIFFLGDGMNHPSVAAARVYAGGEELKLSFENFPYTANSKTYCVDLQVSDSACTTTAYLNGIKANGATIGLNAKAQLYNCEDSMDPTKRTESIGSWAQKAGKDTGFVTTTRVTHASPAGLYAHISYRHWETDASITRNGCDADFLDDVTEQLVHNEEAKKFKVIFGGGSRSFINSTESIHGLAGTRSDGKNLIEEWLAMNPTRVYIDDKQKLMDLNPAEVDEVLGLFKSSHVPYNLQVQESETLKLVKPSLKDMTEKAIDILSKNEDGYFLFVEGGRIDHGHHETRAKYAVDETLELSKAVQAALDKVDIEETLIIVTADHGHAMSMAGYAPRGNDIFGYAGTGTDDLPYFTLSYANGPGYYTHWKHNSDGGRVDSRTLNQTPVNFRFPGTLPRVEATHGGDDVGIWAIGPWAHLFQGVIEQNAIPHILAYASCIGSGLKSCDQ